MNKKQWYELLFENYGQKYDNENFTQGTIGECDFIEKELKSDKSLKILDVGCGRGRHAIELSKRGYTVTGIDLSESQLARAREKAEGNNLEVERAEEELEILRSLPSWKVRVAMAHTIARETRAEEQYKFIPERFADLSVPTLLLLGEESPDYMKKATELVHDALPNSRLTVMSGQQHIAMNTAPELFSNEVIKFLLT
jgi:cyclopropane fatty-acyl-phospholipid synthase-like methyltransferase